MTWALGPRSFERLLASVLEKPVRPDIRSERKAAQASKRGRLSSAGELIAAALLRSGHAHICGYDGSHNDFTQRRGLSSSRWFHEARGKAGREDHPCAAAGEGTLVQPGVHNFKIAEGR